MVSLLVSPKFHVSEHAARELLYLVTNNFSFHGKLPSYLLCGNASSLFFLEIDCLWEKNENEIVFAILTESGSTCSVSHLRCIN